MIADRPARVVPFIVSAAVFAAIAAAAPASADTLPAADCRTDCTAVFDTTGIHSLAIPAGVTELTATVAGAAGARAPGALVILPDATGGAGGATTADLGTSHGGTTLTISVGGTGEGSAIADAEGGLLVVAGGGGGGGYAGRLELPDQVFAAFPGGDGGAPSAPGIAPGGDATAFGGGAFNGLGGAALGGAGGSAGLPGVIGLAGDDVTTSAPGAIALAAGGPGGVLVFQGSDPIEAGDGGSGYTGGGGGAVDLDAVDGGDDIFLDVAAPGGGGSGYLAAGLTAAAEEPNAGAASVTVTWSLPALPPATTPPAEPKKPSLAESGVEAGVLGAFAAALLGVGAAVAFASRRRRASAPDAG